MRVALVASAAVAVAAASHHVLPPPPPATVLCSPPPPPAAIAAVAANESGQQLQQQPSLVSACTATHLSSASHAPLAQANATASQVQEVTGGAIPQQMQASIVGLLGFCIVGLVML